MCRVSEFYKEIDKLKKQMRKKEYKQELVDRIFKLRANWTEEDMLNNGYNNSGDMIGKLFQYNLSQLNEILQQENK